MSYFFFLINASESVIRDLKFLFLRTTKYRFIHMFAELSGKLFGRDFFVLMLAVAFRPLQCSCLENPRDGGAWWAAIYGIAQSGTQLK